MNNKKTTQNGWFFSLKGVEIFQVIICLLQYLLLIGHFVPGAVHHSDSWIFLELFPISGIKMPIQTVERAGTVAGFFGRIVGTRVTVVALFFDVVGRGNVGFGTDYTSIGILAQ
jgi:hypothetical protein